MKRQFVKLNKNATLPERATKHSAGYDISASETVMIQPDEIKMVSTGLRHTHASVLLSEGVSIHTISARLGHADVGVTQETYAHVLDELQKKDDQKMISVLMQIA